MASSTEHFSDCRSASTTCSTRSCWPPRRSAATRWPSCTAPRTRPASRRWPRSRPQASSSGSRSSSTPRSWRRRPTTRRSAWRPRQPGRTSCSSPTGRRRHDLGGGQLRPAGLHAPPGLRRSGLLAADGRQAGMGRVPRHPGQHPVLRDQHARLQGHARRLRTSTSRPCPLARSTAPAEPILWTTGLLIAARARRREGSGLRPTADDRDRRWSTGCTPAHHRPGRDDPHADVRAGPAEPEALLVLGRHQERPVVPAVWPDHDLRPAQQEPDACRIIQCSSRGGSSDPPLDRVHSSGRSSAVLGLDGVDSSGWARPLIPMRWPCRTAPTRAPGLSQLRMYQYTHRPRRWSWCSKGSGRDNGEASARVCLLDLSIQPDAGCR